jgi:hypothetical protein
MLSWEGGWFTIHMSNGPFSPQHTLHNSSASTISQKPYPNPVLLPPYVKPLAPLLGRRPSRCLHTLAAIGLDGAGDADAAAVAGTAAQRRSLGDVAGGGGAAWPWVEDWVVGTARMRSGMHGVQLVIGKQRFFECQRTQ